jgi:stress response protein YsnF
MKNVIGLFDRFEDASQAVTDLVRHGFDRDKISLVANDASGDYRAQMGSDRGREETGKDVAGGAAAGAGVGAVLGGIGGLLVGLGALAIPGIGPVLAAGPLAAALGGAGIGAAAGAVTGGLVAALTDLGIPEEEANLYAESVSRGGTLVIVETQDERADQAVDILNSHNPIDIDRRRQEYTQKNWQRFDETRKPYSKNEIDEMRIPIVDEDMQVGKRQVENRVRVHTYMSEHPVEKDVNLRHERVDVERRPVDRPATDEEINAFQEGTFEVSEIDEEPVVSKQSRVSEEVIINKEVDEEQRTIRGMERHTEVDVDRGDYKDFERFDPEFRKHFDSTYAGRGDYNKFRDAYYYGYQKAHDDRFRQVDWDQANMELRRDWERQYAGQRWDEYSEAVGEGFRRARMRR